MYFNKKENYLLTIGARNLLEDEIILQLINLVHNLKVKDYLQVFEIEVLKEINGSKEINICHTQELNEITVKENEIKLINKINLKVNEQEKIYIIDDITHKTILLSSEY